MLAIASLSTLPLYAQQSAEQPRPANAKENQPAGEPAISPSQSPNTRQQSGQRPVARTANKPLTHSSPADVDKMIAGTLALCNEEEAAVGQFVAQHAENQQVKKFAQMMVSEHGAMAKQLQKWAPEATLMDREKEAENTTNASSDNSGLTFDPLHIHRQIASRSVASTEKSLGSKKGEDFNMAYVGSQCVLHQQMIDKASVLRQYASPELQSAIDKGIKAAESHLEQAQQLIEKLDTDDDSK
jgi:predicted outer membrane protein